MKRLTKKTKRMLVIGLPVVLSLVLITRYEFEHTSTNRYCVTECHIMKPYYESAFHNIHREENNVNCRDCHIPENNLAEALVYKAYSGARDYYKNTFAPPKALLPKEWSKNIIQENCVRCHAIVVERINHTDGKRCFECHRGIPHEQPIQSFSTQQIYTPIR